MVPSFMRGIVFSIFIASRSPLNAGHDLLPLLFDHPNLRCPCIVRSYCVTGGRRARHHRLRGLGLRRMTPTGYGCSEIVPQSAMTRRSNDFDDHSRRGRASSSRFAVARASMVLVSHSSAPVPPFASPMNAGRHHGAKRDDSGLRHRTRSARRAPRQRPARRHRARSAGQPSRTGRADHRAGLSPPGTPPTAGGTWVTGSGRQSYAPRPRR